jgi:hypothetical protein
MARIGIIPRNYPDSPSHRHDQSSRADATALTACRTECSRGAQVALAGLAAIFLLGGPARAKDPAPPLRLRPSIPADSPVIPLPRPRPVIPSPGEISAEPPAPTECQLRMTAEIAVIEPLGHITGPEGCGIGDPVRLSAVMTKDNVRVAITPPATLSAAAAIVSSGRRSANTARGMQSTSARSRSPTAEPTS